MLSSTEKYTIMKQKNITVQQFTLSARGKMKITLLEPDQITQYCLSWHK
jgi:hypothetical protein